MINIGNRCFSPPSGFFPRKILLQFLWHVEHFVTGPHVFFSQNKGKKKKKYNSLSQLAYCNKIRGFWKHLIYFAFSLYLSISSWHKAYLAIGKPEINSRTLFMLSLKTKGNTKKKKDTAKLNWTLFHDESQWAVTLLWNQTWVHSPCAVKQISHQVLMRGNTAFIVGHQARRTGSSW